MTSHYAHDHRHDPVARDAAPAPESGRAGAAPAALVPLAGLAAPQASLPTSGPDVAAATADRIELLRSSLIRRAAAANGDADTLGGRPVDTATASVLRRSSAGRPLDHEVAADLGARLGADFTGARVHTDRVADTVAQSIRATAFTVGSEIFFSRGAYAPSTRDGRALLAHELTHVRQHQADQSTTRAGAGRLTVGRADDPAEQEADAAARAISHGTSNAVRGMSEDPHGPRPGLAARQEQHPLEVSDAMHAGVVRRKLVGDLAPLSAEQLQARYQITWRMASFAVTAQQDFSTIEAIKEAFALQEQQKTKVLPQKPVPKSIERPVLQLPKIAPKKQHTPVSEGGSKLILNFVSLGAGALDPVARFNIYSWRALGHDVHVYTHSLKRQGDDGWYARGLAELGLDEGDAEVHDLTAMLGADSAHDRVVQVGQDRPQELGTPLAEMTSTRSILSSWLAQVPEDLDPKKHKDYIFNVVDVTKSYLGATRQGITLDLKVGPSLHLQDYAHDFANSFVSYSRGGKAVTVENQSMGTMQAGNELRSQYARTFDSNFRQHRESDPVKEAMFNAITGYHQRGHRETQGVDVATTLPSGQDQVPLEKSPYTVPEIGPQGHGPFRVFKKASDQTNQTNPSSTNVNDRVNMMIDALRLELKNDRLDAVYVTKALELEKTFRAEIRSKK